MTLQLLLAFIGYAFVTSITPGPNNTLLLASGANHGFRASLPLLFGINLGFCGLVLAVGLGLGGLFTAMPALHEILRYGGSAYLLYLAWKIARSAPLEPGAETAPPLSFPAAAAFQWVNPKAWIMAVGAVAAYTPTEGYFLNLVLVVIVYALVNGPCIAVWAIGGTLLRGLLADPTRQRVFNIVMAFLLVVSLYPILMG